MRRWGLLALLFIPVFAGTATAGGIIRLALPVHDPEPQPQRPVGEPDIPPSIGLDFFGAELDGQTSHEEAWPWPITPEGN